MRESLYSLLGKGMRLRRIILLVTVALLTLCWAWHRSESMMRQSERKQASSRLLLSHPIFCLLAAVAAAVVLGVLGPIKVVQPPTSQ